MNTSDIAAWVIIGYIIFATAGLGPGLMSGFTETCTYRNILSRINAGYVMGCFLAEPRFLPEQEFEPISLRNQIVIPNTDGTIFKCVDELHQPATFNERCNELRQELLEQGITSGVYHL